MKAMILAAGLGTRLKPLTDKIPKALVEVEGVPVLERIILKLKRAGFDFIVVNVHHHSKQIKDFLSAKNFGVEILISDESEELLDTGGGIVKAFPLLFSKNREPVLFHNVDILSNADIERFMKQTVTAGNSNLIVNNRDSSRKLIFTNNMQLLGWHNIKNNEYRPYTIENKKDIIELAFSGIYCLTEKSIIEMKTLLGNGKYSIMDYFLNPQRTEIINGFVHPGLKLLDIGKPATLLRASELLKDINIILN